MRDANGKPQAPDPEQLAQLLELELMQKRAGWQRTSARRNTYRMLAVVFLVLIIGGAFAAYFFVFSDLAQRPRANQPQTEAPAR